LNCGTTDGGSPDAASPDAGNPDASNPDAGHGDARVGDAHVTIDGSLDTVYDLGGCGCGTAGAPLGLLAIAAFGLFAAGRRRRG
jgi:MYXO-CTERM domain-containing protein